MANGIIIVWPGSMKTKAFIVILLTVIVISQGCNSYRFIHDPSSKKRQHELQNSRAGNACGDVLLIFGTAILGAATGTQIGYMPDEQEFKRINLVNPTNDTLFVNMLTDLEWDKQNYCDFMDIRIPPKNNCRLLVPIYANYNIYFGNTPNPEEDLLLQINTSQKKRFVLNPETLKTIKALKGEESKDGQQQQ